MKNALIIGVGYVGTALAKFWKGRFSVEGTTTKQDRIPEILSICDKATLLKGNDISQVLRAVEGKEIIVVCVAPKYISGAKLDYHTTYLETALTLKEALTKTKNAPNLIYTGSTSVYNKDCREPLKESTERFSEHPDQKILKETEDTYLNLSPSIPVCVLRLSQIIGPAPRDFYSTGKMMAGRTLPVNGDAFPNVIHLEDIVKGITFAVDNQLKGVFNLSYQLRLSRQHIYSKVCQELNLPQVQFNPSEMKNSHVNNAPISIEKIQSTGFHLENKFYQEIENQFK